jgi:hypothetical protein
MHDELLSKKSEKHRTRQKKKYKNITAENMTAK